MAARIAQAPADDCPCFARARAHPRPTRGVCPRFATKHRWIAPREPPLPPRQALNWHHLKKKTMKTKPDADNTELERNFEPLRVTLALGALLLGLLCGLH
jgi:hypothetical protein